MRHLLLFFILLTTSVYATQSDSIPQSLIAPVDSTIASCSDPIDTVRQAIIDSVIASNFFDQQLAWLDTTECTSDTIILECSDSVYKARLKALPFVIEVPYNEVVRNFINAYIKKSARLASLSRRSEYYFPMFEDFLGKYELPYELRYLAVIESALNPQVHSRAGAAGLWQFMPGTGKLYGLEVNSLVDERMDPIKATDAACRFLKNLYNMFGDWSLAMAAYNCGPGNVNKAIHRSGKRDFWSIYPYLPKETRSYVPLFIAAAYVLNYANDHGICPAEADHTMLSDTIQVHQYLHLRQVSDILGIHIDEMRRLNPQYIKDIIPGGEKAYSLCLPLEASGAFIDLQDTILAYRADELINTRRAEIKLLHQQSLNAGVTIYKIKSGDTLGAIAKRYHVTVKQLRKWNNLKNDNIRAGKTLRIGG